MDEGTEVPSSIHLSTTGSTNLDYKAFVFVSKHTEVLFTCVFG